MNTDANATPSQGSIGHVHAYDTANATKNMSHKTLKLQDIKTRGFIMKTDFKSRLTP